jgi:hypothetical protein
VGRLGGVRGSGRAVGGDGGNGDLVRGGESEVAGGEEGDGEEVEGLGIEVGGERDGSSVDLVICGGGGGF